VNQFWSPAALELSRALKIGSGMKRIGLPLTSPSGPSDLGGDVGKFGLRVVISEEDVPPPKRSPQELRLSEERTGSVGDGLLFKRTNLRTGLLSICDSDAGCVGITGSKPSAEGEFTMPLSLPSRAMTRLPKTGSIPDVIGQAGLLCHYAVIATDRLRSIGVRVRTIGNIDSEISTWPKSLRPKAALCYNSPLNLRRSLAIRVGLSLERKWRN